MINPKGQALLETVWVLPCVLFIFASLLAIAYAGFARAWIGYQCDRALFCLAEGESEWKCKQATEKSLKTFLPLGEIRNIQLSSIENQWRADVGWNWGDIHILKQKTLKWDSSIWR